MENKDKITQQDGILNSKQEQGSTTNQPYRRRLTYEEIQERDAALTPEEREERRRKYREEREAEQEKMPGAIVIRADLCAIQPISKIYGKTAIGDRMIRKIIGTRLKPIENYEILFPKRPVREWHYGEKTIALLIDELGRKKDLRPNPVANWICDVLPQKDYIKGDAIVVGFERNEEKQLVFMPPEMLDDIFERTVEYHDYIFNRLAERATGAIESTIKEREQQAIDDEFNRLTDWNEQLQRKKIRDANKKKKGL